MPLRMPLASAPQKTPVCRPTIQPSTTPSRTEWEIASPMSAWRRTTSRHDSTDEVMPTITITASALRMNP